MNFFINNAYANGSAAANESNPYFMVIMLVVFGLFFYFMIIRPQQKRAKAHRQLMSSIASGDEVLTNGGIIGRVVKVKEDSNVVIAINDNNEILIKRDYIVSILPKGTIKSL